MLILGIFMVVIPDCQNLWQLYVSQYLTSFGGGVWDAGNWVWAIEMWGKDASIILQLMQMCYGAGTTLSPVLVQPFLYGDLNKTESVSTTTEKALITSTYTTTYSTTNASIDEDINYSVDRRASLQTPFLIGGATAFLGSY